MLKLKIIFILLMACLACGKEHQPVTPVTKMSLLTSQPWKYDYAEFDLNFDRILEGRYDKLKACDSDNIILFKKDYTGIIDNNSIRCNQNENLTTNFTWRLDTINNRIISDSAIFFGVSKIGSIRELTASKLVVTTQLAIVGTVPFNFEISLKH